MCTEHPSGCPTAEAGRAFFVSVVDHRRTGILAGPYGSHTEALAHVATARERAERADPWSAFYAFGTLQGPDTLRPVFGRLEA